MSPDAGTDGPDREVAGWRWLGATAILALGVLLVVLVLGEGRPISGLPGLPDAGPAVGWGLPIARLLADALGVLTVGLLAAAALLLPLDAGRLPSAGLRCARRAAGLATAWAAIAMVQIVLNLANAAGHLILAPAQLVQFTDVSPLGEALLAQAVLAGLVAVGAAGVLSARAAAVVLAAALVALAPPVLSGHSGSGNEHALATASLLVHLLAAALWVGGLAALVAVRRWSPADLPVAVRRFSPLALWCLVAVALSGAANALVRLGSVGALLDTRYGGLVLAKAAALAILAGFGWRQRQRVLPALHGPGSGRAFGRLAAIEVTVMTATIAIAVGLSRTPPPVAEAPAVSGSDAARLLLGYDLPPEPTLWRLLFDVRLDGYALTAVGLAAALYLTGLRVLRRRGDAWPAGRTIAWFSALAVLLLVTNGGLNRYAPVLFSAHMVQHMALNMVVPILGVLGAPITLALRTLPATSARGGRPPREALLVVLHSLPVRVLTNPLVASVLFVFGLYGLYFSGLFEASMRNHWGHLAMQLHFLAAGGLFFWVLLGIDPAPHRLPHAARVPLLFVVMAFHAFFGVVMLSGTSVIGESYFATLDRPWGRSLIDDQQLGGGIGWALGEPVTLLVLVAVVLQWLRADEREARRFDRAADRAEVRAASRPDAVAGPGDELAAYNARLAALHQQSGPPSSR